jgi:type IV secretory pathway VirB4 component
MVNLFPFLKHKTKVQPLKNAGALLEAGRISVRDLIAPAGLMTHPGYLELNNLLVKTYFVINYPQYVDVNWLTPIINLDATIDISMHVYPTDSGEIMKILQRKVTEMSSSLAIQQEKGAIRDPELEVAYQDAEQLRDLLQRGLEKFFRYGLYITIYGKSQDELDQMGKQIESILGGQLIYTRPAFLKMKEGFKTSLPQGTDELDIVRNMTSSSLATSFPFVSSDLSTGEGILYGVNLHNNSLVLFDRFKLENANMAVFAKSGAGKSYAVKLEILRSLMFDIDAMVIDPENEYKTLAQAVNGTYIDVSLNSDKRINPFDLPNLGPDADGEQILRAAVIALAGLVRLMIGKLTSQEEAILDRAIYETYAAKDITTDIKTHKNIAPTLGDLEQVLRGMEGGSGMAQRLEKFTKGTFAGIFNQPTNVDLERGLVVFSIRDLEEELRPIGMYVILNYIWNKIRYETRKRLLVLDEAWTMMQYEDSAKFVYSIAKRARKYWLGLTTITQDIEDFLDSKYGRAVVANSSLQLLMRQSPASINKVADVFDLSAGEKFFLLEAAVGEGLFFAGNNHAAIKVISSYLEDQIATSDPAQLAKIQAAIKGI